MKLNLLLTILVVLALVVVAALTLRAVIATQAVIYHGEALQTGYSGQQKTQAVTDPCASELAGHGQDPASGIDRCQQDLNLRAPRRVEYASMIRLPQLFKGRRGGCDGLPMPDYTV